MFAQLGYYICVPFAWLTRLFYTWTGSYGVALILFTLMVKLVILPFQLKSKKSMLRMGRMNGKVEEIKKKYPNNQQRQQQEIADLYAREGVNPMSGCLWSFLPFPILIALYYIIRTPLRYFMSLSNEVIESITQLAVSLGYTSGASGQAAAYEQIYLAKFIHENWGEFAGKFDGLIDLDYNFLNTTLDISAISFHKMIQVAKKQDAIAEYGSIVALSYVAAQRTFYGYNDMADAKALLESIARSFGYIYGREKNVRINTISQSPTLTTAGTGVKGMDKLYDFANRMSPLGNASADECADYCIVMFSDLTRKVTMQNLYHDGGFSSIGMSLRAMNTYQKGLDEYKDENGNIIYG